MLKRTRKPLEVSDRTQADDNNPAYFCKLSPKGHHDYSGEKLVIECAWCKKRISTAKDKE